MKNFRHRRSENSPPRKPLVNNTSLSYSVASVLALCMLQKNVVPQVTTPPTAPPTVPPRISRTLTMPDVPVHDPVMIKQGDTYYLFATGNGISVSSSKDLKRPSGMALRAQPSP